MKKTHRQHLQKIDEKRQEHQLPDDAKKTKPRPSNEEERRYLVERKIQEAMANGAFDNLPGHGKPLNLNRNPYMDPAQELAFGLLQNNGLAPDWIERDKANRRQLEQMRQELRRAWQQARADATHPTWQQAVARFEGKLQQLNRQIRDFNLATPVASAQKPLLRLEEEIRRAQAE